MTAFCLEIHARYQCRHSGACCRNWSVPAEPRVIEIVETRRVRRPDLTGALFVGPVDGDPAGTWTVARDGRGDCVFFDRDAGRLCMIHRDAGVDALPSSCRHFPRRTLHDQRGTFISLSHFCPTAAALLFDTGGLTIVEARPPLQLAPPMEGLDASDALPPLLRPALLCGFEGYDAWERAAIATFARDDLRFDECIDLLAAATERARDWQPGWRPLPDHVHHSFSEAIPEDGADEAAQQRAIETVASLSSGKVGNDITPIDDFEGQWQRLVAGRIAPFDAAMKNYLAGRLFGNWVAYQGRGLRTVVEWIRLCAAVVRHELVRRVQGSGAPPRTEDFIEAVRTADLLLLHVVDTAAFAAAVAAIEGPARA